MRRDHLYVILKCCYLLNSCTLMNEKVWVCIFWMSTKGTCKPSKKHMRIWKKKDRCHRSLYYFPYIIFFQNSKNRIETINNALPVNSWGVFSRCPSRSLHPSFWNSRCLKFDWLTEQNLLSIEVQSGHNIRTHVYIEKMKPECTEKSKLRALSSSYP